MSLRSKILSIVKTSAESGNFNRVLKTVVLGDVSKGKVSAEIVVDKRCCNNSEHLHGGFSATLFDHFSTMALRSHFFADSMPAPTSVSVDMNVTFVSGVKLGETIVLETEAVKVGRKVAFLSGTIFNKSAGNRIVATAKQTKFLL